MYLSSLVPRFHVTLNPSSRPLGGLSDGSDQVSVREWAAADTLRCVTFPGAAERIFQMFYDVSSIGDEKITCQSISYSL